MINRIHNFSSKLVAVSFLGAAAAISAAQAVPQPPGQSLADGLEIEQKLGAQIPLDLEFKDEHGNTVKLGDYFGERPVILSMIFFRCAGSCTHILNGMVDSMRAMKKALPGNDFEVITVSIHPTETPELAALKKETYLERLNKPEAAEGWHFLTGPLETTKRLGDAVGFNYKYDAEKDTVQHPAGIMVLTPEGKVSRYFFGVQYPQRQVLDSLYLAADNKIGAVDEHPIKFFCMRYDPTTGRYTLIVERALILGGVMTLFVLATSIFMMSRRYRPTMPEKEEPPKAG
jgi:protein SCO1